MAKKKTTRARKQASGGVAQSAVVKYTGHFLPDLPQRRRLFDFLELSYKGGVGYKFGEDANGARILIEHESEMTGRNQDGIDPQAIDTHSQFIDTRGTNGRQQTNRYARRLRMAAYKNLVRPIVDKFSAYLVRNPPVRDESKKDEFTRIRLEKCMGELRINALKLTEFWIGYDAADIRKRDAEGNPIEDGTALTQSEVSELDPANSGQPYIVLIDPRRVVDFTEDDEGNIARVVIEEIETQKASFVDKPVTIVRYKEWTETDWTLYEVATKRDGGVDVTKLYTSNGIELRFLDSAEHNFGRCPFFRFQPKFPTEDVADLCRSLFNVESLLDEELAQETFTQRYVTGVKPEEVSAEKQGTGNLLVIEASEATVGSLGPEAGAAQSLMDRAKQTRNDIYALVSMEVSEKNVPEAAEKKRRDMESLYTTLIEVVKQVEEIENKLLVGMGILSEDDDKSRTQYDKKFDVTSLTDLLDEIERVTKLPFIPAQLKRELAKKVIAKVDPFGDNEDSAQLMDLMVDTTMDTIDSIDVLAKAGFINADAIIVTLGLPKTMKADIEERLEMHKENAANQNVEFDEEGNPIPVKPGEKPEFAEDEDGDEAE